MYKCKAKKHIYRNYDLEGRKEFGCDAVLDFELPFPPSTEIKISINNGYIHVDSVTYNIDEGVFYCYCRPDFLKPMDGCGYEGLKKIAIEDGWRLSNDMPPSVYDED